MRKREGKKRNKADWLQIDWGWVLAFWPQFQTAKQQKGLFFEGGKEQNGEKGYEKHGTKTSNSMGVIGKEKTKKTRLKKTTKIKASMRKKENYQEDKGEKSKRNNRLENNKDERDREGEKQ
jgi:hypothetical protein